METPAISIIVPIYNMEWCMQKCIDSILAQTFTDFECLLIDDGSTDGSPAICDEYALKDLRIKAYHKPNGGLSDARNYGLERAQGEYTIFADPDDWVDAEGLDKLYEKAKEKNADMVICDIFYNDSHSQRYSVQEPTILNHINVLEDLLTGHIFGFTVNKLLKKEIYLKYDIQYPKGMYGCEDQYTMCNILKHKPKITYVPIAFYHYMHYEKDSLSRHYDNTTYQQDKKIRSMFIDLMKEYPELCKKAYDYKSINIVTRAFKYGRYCFNNKIFKEEFYSYRQLVLSSHMESIVRIPIYISCLGYYHFCNRLFWKGYIIKQKIKHLLWNLKK